MKHKFGVLHWQGHDDARTVSARCAICHGWITYGGQAAMRDHELVAALESLDCPAYTGAP